MSDGIIDQAKRCELARAPSRVYEIKVAAWKVAALAALRKGLLWELNPGPLAPEARIIPLDQAADWYSQTVSLLQDFCKTYAVEFAYCCVTLRLPVAQSSPHSIQCCFSLDSHQNKITLQYQIAQHLNTETEFPRPLPPALPPSHAPLLNSPKHTLTQWQTAPLAGRPTGGPLRWRTAPLADRSAGGPLRWRTAPLADRWRRWRRSSGQCWRTVRLAVWRGLLCWQATVPQLHLVEKHHQIAQHCALLEPPGGRFIKKPCGRVKAILALARQQKGSTPMILNQLASWCNGQHSGL